VICCLIGGALVAALARSARRGQGRPHNPLLALLFGFGGGMLFVALIVTALVPLGVVDVTGPLPARIALLVVPAVMAVAASQAGAGGSLLTRSGTTAVTVAGIGGALVAEEADLHAFFLHSAPGLLAGLAVHLPGFLFLVLGLGWRAKLPEEGPLEAARPCGPMGTEATSGQAGAGPTAGPEVLR
jgi:hypothetical protein